MTHSRDESILDDSVEGFIASIPDPQIVEDSRTLIELMRRVSGHEPTLWNIGTIGFGRYHFRYDSGREGENHTIGFYPRTGKLTVYLMDGTARYADQLSGLGKHTASRVCVYIRRLSEIDLGVLENIVRASFLNLTAQDGQVKRVTE